MLGLRIAEVRAGLDRAGVGESMYRAVEDLYPICRSITGEGLRETLRYVGARIPLDLREVASGTEVLDWTIPREWNIRDAYIATSTGERIVDFRRSNLHVLNYSTPVRARMSLSELLPHLHTLPEAPDWIPYRTSYYRDSWGFCLSHRQMAGLPEGEYEVCIDSTLAPGALTYGECYLPGATSDEVLISCHVCHPSLANDNLSGIVLAMSLAGRLRECALRYSYRFLFIPGTIGSIAWLALNEATIERVKHGLVLACVGDPGGITYKKSRRGDAEMDRVVAHVLQERGVEHRIEEFSPYGYDERQFCSPGFNLPVGCFMRTPHGRFPEYHTSADNPCFVAPAALADSLDAVLAILDVLEGNRRYMNQNPRGEPQLGKRGLYRAMGGYAQGGVDELALLWVLNLSDGEHSLLDISRRSGREFAAVRQAADLLEASGLLKELAT
jgi:aminopeptidase-like protein